MIMLGLERDRQVGGDRLIGGQITLESIDQQGGMSHSCHSFFSHGLFYCIDVSVHH